MERHGLAVDVVEQRLEAVKDLHETGFQVIIYGDHRDGGVHEVDAFTQGPPVVILDREADVEIHRRKVALMATDDSEAQAFAKFVNRFVSQNIATIYELRIINERDASQPARGGNSE